jgi:hypothetical protein
MRQRNVMSLGVALAGLLAGGSAAACALHTLSPELKISHPKALRVAMATRAALDTGLIAPLPEGDEVRREALQALARTSKELAAYADEAELSGPTYSVLLLRSGLWLRFNSWMGPARYHAPPAAPGETTLVLNESAYAALLAGRLSVPTAVEQGVLAVGGTHSAAATAHFAKLLAGFRESPMRVSARLQ